MRNRFAHDYYHLDPAAVWEAIENGLPELESLARDYIARHELERAEEQPASRLDVLENGCREASALTRGNPAGSLEERGPQKESSDGSERG